MSFNALLRGLGRFFVRLDYSTTNAHIETYRAHIPVITLSTVNFT